MKNQSFVKKIQRSNQDNVEKSQTNMAALLPGKIYRFLTKKIFGGVLGKDLPTEGCGFFQPRPLSLVYLNRMQT